MKKIEHNIVREIVQGGPLDRGLSVYLTLDLGLQQPKRTISFPYERLGRVFLILRKVAQAAFDERARHNLEQPGQSIQTQQMFADAHSIAWSDRVTSMSMLRFETKDGLTFDLNFSLEDLRDLRDLIDRHLADDPSEATEEKKH